MKKSRDRIVEAATIAITAVVIMLACGVPWWVITIPLWLPALVLATVFGFGILATMADDYFE